MDLGRECNGQTRRHHGRKLSLGEDKRLHFGLGDSNTASIEVSWPSGKRQTLKNLPADQFLELREPEHP